MCASTALATQEPIADTADQKGYSQSSPFGDRGTGGAESLERLAKTGDIVILMDGRHKLSQETQNKLDSYVKSAEELEKSVRLQFCRESLMIVKVRTERILGSCLLTNSWSLSS